MNFNHADLIIRAEKWLNSKCRVVLTEFITEGRENPDGIGFTGRHSVLVECKATRSDFFSDGKKPHRQELKRCGNYRYYLVPAGLVDKSEVPDGWGLLYVYAKPGQPTSDYPTRIREIVPAPKHIEPEIKVAEYHILYSIARRATLRGLMPEIRQPLSDADMLGRPVRGIDKR